MAARPLLPIIVCTLYVVLVFAGRKIMENKKPFGLRPLLILWNGSLSLFSIIGAIRTVPHLLYLLSTESFADTMCVSPVGHWGVGATGIVVVIL